MPETGAKVSQNYLNALLETVGVRFKNFFFLRHRCLPLLGPVQQADLSAAKMKRGKKKKKKGPLRVLYKTLLPESISRSLFRR